MNFRSDVAVELIDHMGNDGLILRAMKVSVAQDKDVDQMSSDERIGKINFLMKNKHGTPFEHAAMTFRVEAPIFVFREWHRHRIGQSYNEMSARYTILPDDFYMPDSDRNLVQTGKAGHYIYKPGSQRQHTDVMTLIAEANRVAYENYEKMVEMGIAREVARMCLPVNIYSAMYVTLNPRSMMNFLSLRTNKPPFLVDAAADNPEVGEPHFVMKRGGAMFPSKPQREIEMGAEKMEEVFGDLFPITYQCYVDNGRVAP